MKGLVFVIVILVGVQYSTILLRGLLHTLGIGARHPVSAVILYASALAFVRAATSLAWPRRSGERSAAVHTPAPTTS